MMGWAIPEHDEYETVAGFLFYRMRRVPQEGDACRYKHLHFRISRMKGPKIDEVIVGVEDRPDPASQVPNEIQEHRER
jgi:CBS domain containing-hemolysin-like protein